MLAHIPFNKPFITGRETQYILEAVSSGKVSGNGLFSQKCQRFFEENYDFKKTLLTTSCTDALEMSSLLTDIEPGDEVIVPSYTFVSTANAFVLRGAKIVFADSEKETPNLDVAAVEALITPRTKVIVPVHYAGIAVDMDPLMQLADKREIYVVEDAAQAIEASYNGRPLGSIGHLSTFSFHETKNVICGEGGMLAINHPAFVERSEILWEKGTNRAAFFRGEVNKYGWVDIGSSFLPSDILAAFLYAQLEHLQVIQEKRISLWERYYAALKPLEDQGVLSLPHIPPYASNNGHMFYIVCYDLDARTRLLKYLKQKNVNAVFHYLSLHKSPYYQERHDGRALPNADRFTDCLLRLPMYYELSFTQLDYICDCLHSFFRGV